MLYPGLFVLLLASSCLSGANAMDSCKICQPKEARADCATNDPMPSALPVDLRQVKDTICSVIENNHTDYHNSLCEKYPEPLGYLYRCMVDGGNTYTCRSTCGPRIGDVGKGLLDNDLFSDTNDLFTFESFSKDDNNNKAGALDLRNFGTFDSLFNNNAQNKPAPAPTAPKAAPSSYPEKPIQELPVPAPGPTYQPSKSFAQPSEDKVSQEYPQTSKTSLPSNENIVPIDNLPDPNKPIFGGDQTYPKDLTNPSPATVKPTKYPAPVVPKPVTYAPEPYTAAPVVNSQPSTGQKSGYPNTDSGAKPNTPTQGPAVLLSNPSSSNGPSSKSDISRPFPDLFKQKPGNSAGPVEVPLFTEGFPDGPDQTYDEKRRQTMDDAVNQQASQLFPGFNKNTDDSKASLLDFNKPMENIFKLFNSPATSSLSFPSLTSLKDPTKTGSLPKTNPASQSNPAPHSNPAPREDPFQKFGPSLFESNPSLFSLGDKKEPATQEYPLVDNANTNPTAKPATRYPVDNGGGLKPTTPTPTSGNGASYLDTGSKFPGIPKPVVPTLAKPSGLPDFGAPASFQDKFPKTFGSFSDGFSDLKDNTFGDSMFSDKLFDNKGATNLESSQGVRSTDVKDSSNPSPDPTAAPVHVVV